MDKESVCSFALGKICKYEPLMARRMVEVAGSAWKVFGMHAGELRNFLGPYNKYTSKILEAELEDDEKEMEYILSLGHSFICHDSPLFPEALSMCEDAPLGFFASFDGCPEDIFNRECISVVGTRDISPYGKECCSKIVAGLAKSSERPTIVSGLAFGVDICAHLTALDTGLPTIAVLGTGIGQIYPHQHQAFAERIIRTRGCAVISEYPPDGCFSSQAFLYRNRIVAGMSRATVLVESRIRGGGMTTARIASSYGREVFAVPGRNSDIRSQGCNHLIYSHIAEPLTSCTDFFNSLNYKRLKFSAADAEKEMTAFYEGNMDKTRLVTAIRIFKIIKKDSGIQICDIAGELGIDLKLVLSLCARMENDGFIETDILQRCVIKRRIS